MKWSMCAEPGTTSRSQYSNVLPALRGELEGICPAAHVRHRREIQDKEIVRHQLPLEEQRHVNPEGEIVEVSWPRFRNRRVEESVACASYRTVACSRANRSWGKACMAYVGAMR